jgi:hypothetical protein
MTNKIRLNDLKSQNGQTRFRRKLRKNLEKKISTKY